MGLHSEAGWRGRFSEAIIVLSSDAFRQTGELGNWPTDSQQLSNQAKRLTTGAIPPKPARTGQGIFEHV